MVGRTFFNTQDIANQLTAAGLTSEQADVIVQLLVERIEVFCETTDELATELREHRGRIDQVLAGLNEKMSEHMVEVANSLRIHLYSSISSIVGAAALFKIIH